MLTLPLGGPVNTDENLLSRAALPRMKHTLKKALSVLFACLAVGLVPSVHAITISDPGVVGVVTLNGNNINSNPSTEAGLLNTLLAMAANASQTIAGIGYQTGPTDYTGTVSGGVQTDGGGTSVPAGFGYVLAKYDGPNGGYVAWSLGGLAFTLPQFPAPLFTTNPQQYALSHFTVFNPTTVPDGGSTLALLAVTLLAGEGLRRKLRKV